MEWKNIRQAADFRWYFLDSDEKLSRILLFIIVNIYLTSQLVSFVSDAYYGDFKTGLQTTESTQHEERIS